VGSDVQPHHETFDDGNGLEVLCGEFIGRDRDVERRFNLKQLIDHLQRAQPDIHQLIVD